MANKKMQQPEEPLTEEQEVVLDTADEALEALRASIRELEEKEAILSEKLKAARATGLADQADRVRALLQKVVLMKNRKKDELKEAEARKLADELDAFAADVENELYGDPADAELEEAQNEHLSKSKRLGMISKLVGFIGAIACVIGALAYLIMTQVEVLNLPFEWIWLIADAALLAVVVVIAVAIGTSASHHRRLAEEIEADRLIAEQERLERAREELLALECLNATSEAYTLETENAGNEKKSLVSLNLPKVPENVKQNVQKIAPVAAVCTVAVAAAAVATATKASAEARRAAAARKEFFEWLG